MLERWFERDAYLPRGGDKRIAVVRVSVWGMTRREEPPSPNREVLPTDGRTDRSGMLYANAMQFDAMGLRGPLSCEEDPREPHSMGAVPGPSRTPLFDIQVWFGLVQAWPRIPGIVRGTRLPVKRSVDERKSTCGGQSLVRVI